MAMLSIKRREELRHMATTQVAAIERKAIIQIETLCLDAQTTLAVSGLTSESADLSLRRCRRSIN